MRNPVENVVVEGKFGNRKPNTTTPAEESKPVKLSSSAGIRDVVFEEHYAPMVKNMLNHAFMQGRQHEFSQLMALIKDFESKKITVTVDGIVEYLASIQNG